MILVTALEPFGFIRGTLMRANASLDVLEALRAEDSARYHFQVLPVSDEGIAQLGAVLRSLKPSGLLAMGENALLLPDRVLLEPFAVNCRPSILPDFLVGGEQVNSPFAQSVGAEPPDSRMGRYYCNAAHLAGLQWAAGSQGEPVAFVHVPALPPRDRHVAQVRALLRQMEG